MDSKPMSKTQENYLKHYGVKGMRWGRRKDNKPQGWSQKTTRARIKSSRKVGKDYQSEIERGAKIGTAKRKSERAAKAAVKTAKANAKATKEARRVASSRKVGLDYAKELKRGEKIGTKAANKKKSGSIKDKAKEGLKKTGPAVLGAVGKADQRKLARQADRTAGQAVVVGAMKHIGANVAVSAVSGTLLANGKAGAAGAIAGLGTAYKVSNVVNTGTQVYKKNLATQQRRGQ